METKSGGDCAPPNHFLRPLEAAGTGGAQKYRGSGAPNPNQHPNQPLCHAMSATAIVFYVVAKFCTEATNLLKFCMEGNDGWLQRFWVWIVMQVRAGYRLNQ